SSFLAYHTLAIPNSTAVSSRKISNPVANLYGAIKKSTISSILLHFKFIKKTKVFLKSGTNNHNICSGCINFFQLLFISNSATYYKWNVEPLFYFRNGTF